MTLKPTPNPRRRASRVETRQQTQTKLRDAALHEFALRGVAGTSAERIAEAAGYSKGAFYANFRNKEALLLDLMQANAAAEAPEWVRLSEEGADVDAVLAGMQARAQAYDPDGRWALMSMEVHLAACRDPELAAGYERFQSELRAVTRLFLQRLFERVGKAPPLPLDTLADALMAMRMSLNLPRPQHAAEPPQHDPAGVLALVLRGFLAAGTAWPATSPKGRTRTPK